MSQEMITTEQAENIYQDSVQLVEFAESFRVANQNDLSAALEFVRNCEQHITKVDDLLAGHIADAYAQHKKLKDSYKGLVEQADEASGIVRERIKEYLTATTIDNANDVKGLSAYKQKKVSYDNSFIQQTAKLVGSGKLPVGLFKIDTKVLADLVNAGVDVVGATATEQTIIKISKA